MSPARRAHDAPTRRRPPATHDRAARHQAPEDQATEDEATEDEPPDDESPDGERDDDEPVDGEPDGDGSGDEAPDEPDDEPDDEASVEPDDGGPEDEPAEDEESPDASEPPPAGGPDAQDAARLAVRHLRELTNHRPEGVVGIARDDEGWAVTVEVLEGAHVPSTSDVLAEYEVRLDADGGLRGVTRGRRYVRGQTER